MDILKEEEEQEDSYGEYLKMRSVVEMKINLYKCCLKKSELTDRMDRLTLENKRNGLCHIYYH
jgi:hypothetical protein